MARCDQCHIEGGLKVGKKILTGLQARFEFIVEGAKTRLCEGHLQRVEREFRNRGIDIKYTELEGDEND